MSRGVLIDYFGRAGAALSLAGSQENRSVSTEKGTDERGDTEQTELYAEIMDPGNDYSVKASVNLATLIIGVLADGYYLTGFTATTAAGAQPKLSLTGAEAPEGDTQGYTYTPPAGTLLKDWAAQILFGAFTLAGAGCHVKSCSAKGAATFQRGEDATAEPDCSNLSGASLEVTAEIEQLGATAPTLTAGEGWKITSPLTQTEDTKTFKKYAVTLSLSAWAGTPPA